MSDAERRSDPEWILITSWSRQLTLVIFCEVLLLLIVSALHLSFICSRHTLAINDITAQTQPLSDPKLYYSSVHAFVSSVHDRLNSLPTAIRLLFIRTLEGGQRARAVQCSSGAHLHHYQLLNPSPSSSPYSDMFITEQQAASATSTGWDTCLYASQSKYSLV